MDEPLQCAQIGLIRCVSDTLRAARIGAWLFGGWGLDAQIGQITRPHGDVEFWVERSDADASQTTLMHAGATVLRTQPPEEACEFEWNDVPFSTGYFDRQPDGSFTPAGRWSDWIFPPRSFSADVGTLNGSPVPTMSLTGMLAMKEQYPRLRNGRPWRPKDILDMQRLRQLVRPD
jgi:lincosamide nucleotidyltransferase A/C/D/E